MGPRDLSDQELVSRCQRDLEAFHESFRMLYDRHAPVAYRFLRSMVGDEAALDCLQETFLRVFSQLHRYDAARPFQPWLLGVARNVAIVSRRDFARRPHVPMPTIEPPQRGPGAVEVVQQREERALFRQALAELPDSEREVFLLRKTEGLTYEHVADAVGCSIRTAKHRMRSALTLLSQGLRRRGLVGGVE